jgi:hypothetical protein
MKLHEIKTQLGYETLGLNTVATATGEKTSWMKHWDNDNRIAVLIHRDTFVKLKANPECPSLGIKTAVKQGSKGEYTAHTIVMYSEAEETL